MPFAARRRVAGVVEIHQHQIERRDSATAASAASGELTASIRMPLGLEQQPQRIDQVRLIVGDQDPRLNSAGCGHFVSRKDQ